MIIDRNFVSKKFKCRIKRSDLVFDYDDLVDLINYWKAIFQDKHKLVAGNRIMFGYSLIDIYYIGAILAATELGLQLVINDNAYYNKAKLEMYFPLDLYVTQSSLQIKEQEAILQNSLQVEHESIFDQYQIQFPERFPEYISTMCQPSNLMMLCTSSGTTGPPKSVRHTHAFMASLSARNARVMKFDGQVCHTKSLHHGSGLAAFFLPALTSDKCDCHHIFPIKTDADIAEAVQYFLDWDINHVQFSYRKEIESFLQQSVDQKARYRDLTIRTLGGYIDPEWQKLLKQIGNVRIITGFGCNEAGGPMMTNQLDADTKNFDYRNYVACDDDYYKLELTKDGRLQVTPPTEFNLQETMPDSFEVNGNVYTHLGRADMFRIREMAIEAKWFLSLCRNLKIDGELVFDSVKQKIYYADWGSGIVDDNVAKLNNELDSKYGVSISTWKVLRHQDYVYGVKVDHPLLRETFNNS
jgi:acyl-coenzyme A synthetase/AMP-(fatty) acid ligase